MLPADRALLPHRQFLHHHAAKPAGGVSGICSENGKPGQSILHDHQRQAVLK